MKNNILLFLGIIMIVLGVLVAIASPIAGILAIAVGILEIYISRKKKKEKPAPAPVVTVQPKPTIEELGCFFFDVENPEAVYKELGKYNDYYSYTKGELIEEDIIDRVYQYEKITGIPRFALTVVFLGDTEIGKIKQSDVPAVAQLTREGYPARIEIYGGKFKKLTELYGDNDKIRYDMGSGETPVTCKLVFYKSLEPEE